MGVAAVVGDRQPVQPELGGVLDVLADLVLGIDRALGVRVVVAGQPQAALGLAGGCGGAAEHGGAGGGRAEQAQPTQEGAATQVRLAQLTVRDRLVQERGHGLVVVVAMLVLVAWVPGHLSSSASSPGGSPPALSRATLTGGDTWQART